MTDPVAEKIQRGIGRIFAKLDFLASRKLLDCFSRTAEQRPDQQELWIARRSITPPHSRQPFNPGSPKQTQEEKLHLIVRVVAESDRARLAPARHACQKFMA